MIKNRWIAASAVLFAVALLAAGVVYGTNEVLAEQELTNEDFIRFHVIANSDSEEDQALKLKVRDHLIEVIDEGLIREAVSRSDGSEGESGLDIDESREYINENIDEIETEARKIIRQEGYDYTVEAEMRVCWIPEKTYGSVIFPAGNYEALRILIGEGEGENWWCVLYPPLCLIDSEHNAYESDEILRDSIVKGKYDELEEAAHSGAPAITLKLKFKSLELLKEA